MFIITDFPKDCNTVYRVKIVKALNFLKTDFTDFLCKSERSQFFPAKIERKIKKERCFKAVRLMRCLLFVLALTSKTAKQKTLCFAV